MQTATSSNRLDRWEMPGGAMLSEFVPNLIDRARENVRLAQENEVLRQSCDDLTAAAETWIRLYEAALSRANAAERTIAAFAAGNE
jgi:hypothetical protein